MTRPDRTYNRVRSPDEWDIWLIESPKGASVVYGEGMPGPLHRRVWRAVEGGLVTTVQRRETDGELCYIAQRL